MSEKQLPGTFSTQPEIEGLTERLRQLQAIEQNPQLYGGDPNDSFVEELDLAARFFNLSPAIIYYPGCDTHVGPSFVNSFKQSRIVYVDKNEASVAALQKEGYEAHVGDVESFSPGNVDLLILLNFNHDQPPKQVIPGGYVVCNDWWGAATSLKDNPDFELSGVIIMEKDTDEPTIESDDLTDYITKVQTEYEWEEAVGSDWFQYERSQVEKLNSSLAEELRVDTTNLLQAISELKRRTKLNGFLPKIPYKKTADLWIFRKRD